MSRAKKAVVAAALAGLPVALLAELLALGLAGAGHGWVAPLFFGLGLFLAWPATFAILTLERRRRLCGLLLLAGLAADAALAFHTLDAESAYFARVFAAGPIVTLLWLLLWLGWQVLLLVHLLKPGAGRDQEA